MVETGDQQKQKWCHDDVYIIYVVFVVMFLAPSLDIWNLK